MADEVAADVAAADVGPEALQAGPLRGPQRGDGERGGMPVAKPPVERKELAQVVRRVPQLSPRSIAEGGILDDSPLSAEGKDDVDLVGRAMRARGRPDAPRRQRPRLRNSRG